MTLEMTVTATDEAPDAAVARSCTVPPAVRAVDAGVRPAGGGRRRVRARSSELIDTIDT
jgi:hypothetical protein